MASAILVVNWSMQVAGVTVWAGFGLILIIMVTYLSKRQF
ncbi:putative membrane protein [Brucella thiophenivorans]|uniref:Putative membrane protein n=1 Tax=Brucella thiophenivorans TaxID=571255 RepID=A0A256FWW5_9HYPH|nr:putative membrane protein [Brucella thiophenivorans]